MKKALVLAGGLPQIELVNELKNRGYYTVLVDYSDHPIAESAADKFYKESTLDIDMVRRIAINEHVNMIITCCTDQALATVSLLAQELNLPCYINKKTGQAVTNKQYMKSIFVENGIPTARFVIAEDLECSIDFDFPMVVKPVDCNSSKGVEKVFNEAQLRAAIMHAISYSRTHKAVVEEFIEGKEISIDAFVTGGRAEILCTSFSEKIADSNKFVIYKGQYPANISEHVYMEIELIAQKIADAFELENSPMLIQVLVNRDKVYVVEFSARTGGCVKHRMIELASGVDVIKATVDLFEGLQPSIIPKRYQGYIVDEFVYCDGGIFDHIDGMDICISNNWVKEFYTLKRPGECVGAVKSSGDRIAALVYDSQTYDEYVSNHNNVVDHLHVIDSEGNDIMRHDLLTKL